MIAGVAGWRDFWEYAQASIQWHTAMELIQIWQGHLTNLPQATACEQLTVGVNAD